MQPALPPKKKGLLEAPLITFPYRGIRGAYFVYHPHYHGPSFTDGLWPQVLDRFMKLFTDFCNVTELYNDEAVRSETVGGEEWKKEVSKLVRAIGEDKDVYTLEALAFCLFDYEPGEKSQQRMLPYHKELKDAAGELRAADLGTKSTFQVNGSNIVKHGWAG